IVIPPRSRRHLSSRAVFSPTSPIRAVPCSNLFSLLPFELWWPLLQKRLRPFTHVFRRASHSEKRRLQEQTFFLCHFHAAFDCFPIVCSRWKTLCPKSENSFPLTGVCNASSLISAPATNAFSPAPVRINTRKAWSSRASSKAPCNSSTVLRFSAFSTFGRLKVMYAIPSLFSYKIFS